MLRKSVNTTTIYYTLFITNNRINLFNKFTNQKSILNIATIQIKNWKPLALDQVTDDKRTTVGEVLGDISTFVTLRIRLYR